MSTQLRSYKDYFLESRKHYVGNKPDLDFFYRKGVMELDISQFGDAYMGNIQVLSKIVDEYFSKRKPTDNPKLIKYEKFDYIKPYINNISSIVVPYLEENLYGCNLYVDKVYTWRNVEHNQKEDSWIWHFDNNPNEIYKVMIYLSDVDEHKSPFQYLVDDDGFGKVIKGTRQGMDQWKTILSRLSDNEIKNFVETGYKVNSMVGKKGSATIFNNNLVHRATTPEKNNHRDVVVLRVKPTIKKIKCVDEKYTTSWETSGVVNQNPSIIGD